MTISKAPEATACPAAGSAPASCITSHQNPDGDAVGSGLALARLLRGLGKGDRGLAVATRCPASTAQLPGSERIHTGDAPPAGYPGAFDTVVVLECPSLDRTGLGAELAGPPVLNIDHHLGNSLYGEVNWVDTAAPAVRRDGAPPRPGAQAHDRARGGDDAST